MYILFPLAVPWKWVPSVDALATYRNRGYTLILNVAMDSPHFMDHVHAFKGLIIDIYCWCDGFWLFRISLRLLWDHGDQVRLLGIIKTVWLVDRIIILKLKSLNQCNEVWAFLSVTLIDQEPTIGTRLIQHHAINVLYYCLRKRHQVWYKLQVWYKEVYSFFVVVQCLII